MDPGPDRDPDALGPAWLAAAIGGGLPEPTRSRWQPLRVGIVNLWEYDVAELWFADGRLVLRGGNGAGKTKVLELTTLMLLRGEIAASVLDPFGSQHRTMRYNLLPSGEGDDPRVPADSGLGYAWVEFGRRDERGEARYFSCGMGASARRGSGTSGVATWHFVTALRPGKDFSLVAGGRAIEKKDLNRLDGLTTPPSATAYRARLAGELFGLTTESYDNLTELLKQLRRPKLGERLNPDSLAQTLREALPPLAGHEIAQLADGWDQLEQLRRAVEQTEEAATAVARFVSNGWRPWARVVLRRRADDMASATTDLDNTTREKNKAEEALKEGRSEVTVAEEQLGRTTQTRQDRETERRELLDSRAFRDAVGAARRADELGRETESLRGQLRTAGRRREQARQDLDAALEQVGSAQAELAGAERAVTGSGDRLAAAAEPAGLTRSVERHLPDRDVDALAGDLAQRRERFAHLQRLNRAHGEAAGRAERSGQKLESAQEARTRAEADESRSRIEVGQHAEDLAGQIRDWGAAAVVAATSDARIEQWCDLISDLTVIDEETGTRRPGRSVIRAVHDHVGAAGAALATRAEDARLRRAPLGERQAALASTLDEVRKRTETPPPAPPLWQRRARPALDADEGAPLWRLIDPVRGVDAAALDRLEAALVASGLLDVWITPDGTLATDDGALVADVQALAGPRPTGPTLLAVLAPQGAGGVVADVVRDVLGRVGWFEQAPASGPEHWVAADGSWRSGALTGRADPAGPAAFIGTAAREAARQRTVAALEAELAEVAGALGALDEELRRIAEGQRTLAAEQRTIPESAEDRLTAAVTTLAERARQLQESTVRLDEARREHDDDLTTRDQAWAALADYAGEHRFAVRNLDEQAAALHEYRSRLDTLIGDLKVLVACGAMLGQAEAGLRQRAAAHRSAGDEVDELTGKLRQADVRLATAKGALDTNHQTLLDRRDVLDGEIPRLDEEIIKLHKRVTDAEVAAARAQEILHGHEAARARAEESRDRAMAVLWSVADHGLVEPAGLTSPERRTVVSARELAAAARRAITVAATPADEVQARRRCDRHLEELRQHLLPNRDARVEEADEADEVGIERVVVLADPARGWQAPDQAADALAERVREQRDGYDEEQQRVLTTLLGSTFIEHLKDRLDYAEHTFARINDQLARHPTRHGNVVRVLSEPDPADPDTAPVVTALGRGYHELSAERQDMVRSFLARRIDEARDGAAAGGSSDWTDQLEQALDYRRWLRLSLQHRPGVGSPWAVFDAAKHSAKSGGEKVVLLSLPLFAAAVVAYDAAGPLAPRWVWLDEAMTGVDAAIKASFMGLTVDFDLDVMLTAHDEWCNYPTVPAVAVYDLARQAHLPGVDILPYLWCGGEMNEVAVDRLGVSPLGAPAPEGLFAVDDEG